MIRHWLRDPLAHFLIAGAVIWAGLALVGEPVDPASRSPVTPAPVDDDII